MSTLKIIGKKIDNPNIVIVEIDKRLFDKIKENNFFEETYENVDDSDWKTIVDFWKWEKIENIKNYLEKLTDWNG